MTIIIITSLTLTAITSFFIGKYSERIKQNKLIESGILPKPKIKK